jgi:CheY-like chemotaxis protein
MAGQLVLIVEDNEKNLKLARDVLQYNGFRTIEAVNALDGIALAGQELPDLILLDIQLPDLDGVSALLRLRADDTTAAIPVVALTASAMTQDQERFLAAGFDGYLSKPISVKEFPAQVNHFCETGRKG